MFNQCPKQIIMKHTDKYSLLKQVIDKESRGWTCATRIGDAKITTHYIDKYKRKRYYDIKGYQVVMKKQEIGA